MQTYDLLKFAQHVLMALTSPYNTTQSALHKQEWSDIKDRVTEKKTANRGGKCRNATNRRSRVGMSSSFYSTLIWSSTMLFSGATTKMHVFGFEASFTSQNNWKMRLFPKPVGKITITSRSEIRARETGNVTNNFLQCFSHHRLVSGFDCWQFVVNASRISQSYFCVVSSRPTHISLALAVRAVSLFFFSGCRPRFSRLAASPLDSLSHARG